MSSRAQLVSLRAMSPDLSTDNAGDQNGTSGDLAHARHRAERTAYWDRVAALKDTWEGWGGAYHERLAEVYRHLVAPGLRVLEIGCSRGDLLAALSPGTGVGVDLSGEMIDRARQRHPALRFIKADALDISVDDQFDVVILSDLVNELWDVQGVLERIRRISHAGTRVIVNTQSRLWDVPLTAVEKLGLAKPMLRQNWLTVHDIRNMLALAGFETMRTWQEVMWPLRTPLIAPLLNKYATRMWGLRHLSLANFILARPAPSPAAGITDEIGRKLVSVIVPARNEAGNIREIVARVPEMGAGTELIFVEGHSRDDTFAEIQRVSAEYPERRVRAFQQTGKGKGDAVRLGFAEATGDVLMILDADMTVPPEELPRFYRALVSGKGDFINGVRLVYPMERSAMRPLNLFGNKFFGAMFSWLLGQPLRDTLCGTKVIRRTDYEMIAANRHYFGEFDPFGDFDLLFGAAKLNLKIVDMPIRYRERTYGETNIQRFRHGWMLLRMVAYAARRIKFV
ncbi:MAG TPA: glycosyltransferase [Gemmatimonadaceae bacterium]